MTAPIIAGNNEKGNGETIPFSTTGVVTKKDIIVTAIIPKRTEEISIFVFPIRYIHNRVGRIKPMISIFTCQELKENKKIEEDETKVIDKIHNMKAKNIPSAIY